MYDTNNMPARTQMSHYLRTGQILPPENFTDHKSCQPAYGEDDSLCHKSFSTDDFIAHYFLGGGWPVNLGAIGLLDEFRNTRSVINAVNDFKERQIRLAIQKALGICRKLQKTKVTKTQVRFTDRDNTTTDVTNDGALFSIGNSTFFRSSRCMADIDCSKKYLTIEGTMTYEIKDWFKDPGNIFNKPGGEREIPGGKPYPIVAEWQERLYWEGVF